MIIQVNNTYSKIAHATEREQRWLEKLLSYPDRSYRAPRGARLSMIVHSSNEFPTGLLPLIRQRAKDRFRIQLVDRRIAPTKVDSRAMVDWLRPHQDQAVDVARKHVRGIFHHPTGSGKTEVIVALPELYDCTWLVLTHKKDLLVQTQKRFASRTGEHAGIVGDGERDFSRRVTIAMMQTIYNGLLAGDKKIQDLVANVRGIIVDECHVSSAQTFWRVLMSCKMAYFRFGFSGTPFGRSDQRSVLTVAALGPRIHRIFAQDLINEGYLSRPNVIMVPVKHKGIRTKGRATWDAIYKAAIVKNDERNEALVRCAVKATKPSFLFVKHLEHGRYFEQALQRKGISTEFVWGAKITKQRAAALRRLAHGDTDVIVTSPVFQEGIDVPELRSVIHAPGGKSQIVVLQNLGRGSRRHDKSGRVTKDEFEVYDIQDVGCGCSGLHENCKWVHKHTKMRLAAYASEKFQVFVRKV